jgi:hypothetical protein
MTLGVPENALQLGAATLAVQATTDPGSPRRVASASFSARAARCRKGSVLLRTGTT